MRARVEPDQADGAVAGEQFLHLRLGFAAQVLVVILLVVGTEIPGVAGAVGLVPVLRLRVIDAEADVVALARVGQFLERIAMEGRGVVDVVLADRRAIHGEAVVVLAGDDDVLHAGVFGHLHPCFGIELHGVELLGELFVFLHRNLGAIHDPFADAGDRLAFPLAGGNAVEAPVDEQAELGFAKPFHLLVLGHFGGRGGAARHGEKTASSKAAAANAGRGDFVVIVWAPFLRGF